MSTTEPDDGEGTQGKLDLPPPGPWEPPTACGDNGCTPIDVLFVVDNSRGMGEVQKKLSASMRAFVERLEALSYRDPNSESLRSLYLSVNVMFTTTDMGHPLCTAFQHPDYVPRAGAPVYTGCNHRINRFTGLGSDPEIVPEACTDPCPSDIDPSDLFVHFDPFESNVSSDRYEEALACLAPQGVDGCGYEAPLESMFRALQPNQCWNDPGREACQAHPEWSSANRPFLRDDATLAIVIVTDETECSVASPGGEAWFTGRDDFWETDPHTGSRSPTSAICWNAGVECDDIDGDGVYEGCVSVDHGVLHPVSRYTEFLASIVEGAGGVRPRGVVMLGILGVPSRARA